MSIDNQIFILQLNVFVAFANAHVLKRYAGHYEVESLSRELVKAQICVPLIV